jgi:hypothetical protein
MVISEMEDFDSFNAKARSTMAPPKKKTKRELEEENEKLKHEIEALRLKVEQQEQQLAQGITKSYVFSTSSAAKDNGDVDEFHKKLLCKDEWKGSFVAYKYYIEVVKGARRMTREPQETVTGSSGMRYNSDDEWKHAIKEINKEAKVLMSSFQKSTDRQFWDAENPQSDILAKLMESALSILSRGKSHGLRVTHQYEINVPVTAAELETSIRKSAPGKNDTTKLEFVPDVAVWMVDEHLRRNWLASFEFKPNNSKPDWRLAQAEMNAINIIMHRGRPCICVDVAGSRDFSKWSFRASALVPNPMRTQSTEYRYVKSCFLGGDVAGAKGILMLAAGLLQGMPFFNDEKLKLLGPSVAVVPTGNDSALPVDRVVKAYDRSTCCKPNIDLVRMHVDQAAVIWTSRDSHCKVQLVETRHFESDWTKEVPCTVFVAILGHLKNLHDAGKVHGDVRLGNMLSCGLLVDLDYIGLQTYPSGLKAISDGERHPSVQKGIDDRSVDTLPPDKEHDLFSMGAAMKMFKPSDSDYESVWLEATNILQVAGDNAMGLALAKLGELDSVLVKLTDESMEKIFSTGLTVGGNPHVLLATGGTPEAPKSPQ